MVCLNSLFSIGGGARGVDVVEESIGFCDHAVLLGARGNGKLKISWRVVLGAVNGRPIAV